MPNKEKIVDLIVVGSGLSSLIFIDAYLEKRKKVEIISPQINFKNEKLHKKNDHIFKILPPQMFGKENNVKSYFQYNNIFLDKNCKLFGSLEFGGLSNYWGLQVDPNIEEDLKNLSKSTKKKIVSSFIEILKKLNLIGKFKTKKKVIDNSIEGSHFFNFPKIDNSKLKISKLILGFQNKKKLKKIEKINEVNDKLVPNNYFNQYLKKKKIKIHNFYVKKIKKHKKGIELVCHDNRIQKSLITKKLVLGCGTIISTKLVADFLNYRREIKLRHHPRLFTLFFLKKRWFNKMTFQPPMLHIKPKSNKNLFTTDFRPGNQLIINSILKFKKYLYPFKYILSLLRFNFLFLNTFLNPKFSNLYLRLNSDNSMKIYSKDMDVRKVFKKTSSMVYSFFRKTKKIFPFRINYFPGFGADFHYFGTMKINGKGSLSVNERCQLKKNKNIYIIDGSPFNFENNKYPIGLVLANSRRSAKEIIKKSK